MSWRHAAAGDAKEVPQARAQFGCSHHLQQLGLYLGKCLTSRLSVFAARFVQMEDIEKEKERSHRLNLFKYQNPQAVHIKRRQHALEGNSRNLHGESGTSTLSAHGVEGPGEAGCEIRNAVQELHGQLRSLHLRRAQMRAGVCVCVCACEHERGDRRVGWGGVQVSNPSSAIGV